MPLLLIFTTTSKLAAVNLGIQQNMLSRSFWAFKEIVSPLQPQLDQICLHVLQSALFDILVLDFLSVCAPWQIGRQANFWPLTTGAHHDQHPGLFLKWELESVVIQLCYSVIQLWYSMIQLWYRRWQARIAQGLTIWMVAVGKTPNQVWSGINWSVA